MLPSAPAWLTNNRRRPTVFNYYIGRIRYIPTRNHCYYNIIRSSPATYISDRPARTPSTDPRPNVNIVSNGYFWPAEVRSTERQLYHLVSSIDWEQLGPRKMLGHCVRECKIVPTPRPRVFRRRH